MKYLFLLLLFTIGYNSLLCLNSDDKIRLSAINGSHLSNNLKVNNQMRAKGETINTNFISRTEIINKSRDTSIHRDNVKGMPEEYNIGPNSLRTSEIIYNGTQVITLLLFIMVLFVGLFILTIIIFPKYAKKLGFKRKNEDDNTNEQELTDVSLQEEFGDKNTTNYTDNRDDSKINKFESIHSRKVLPSNCFEFENISDSNSKNQFSRNSALTLNRSKNYSLRRHSLISDGSSDNCKIASRPRSSSSLPFVQAFTDTMDESTTGDESTCRVSKGTTLKNLLKKKNNSNADVYNSNNKNLDDFESSSFMSNSLAAVDDEESSNSPTSASAVVAIQMSELLARWNPKKDSRLIQKSNFVNNIRSNNNITFDKLGNKGFFSNNPK
ncbi:hypothetical protein FG379_003291 [Cryptosporidium bovis]|uniref:uncharacterized protein n=1 Tax=Cryptosporidium bovis TaxID=310047 RepID=UPI00351A43F5|nr:hypothetical protein FG379_003291 [Cryptosporidium bovis]